MHKGTEVKPWDIIHAGHHEKCVFSRLGDDAGEVGRGQASEAL